MARTSPARTTSAPASVAEAHAAIAVLSRLAELYRERREQLAAFAGITDQQWEVLEEVATEHFMPSLFAKTRESSAAAVSKILRQLTDKGLVVAQVSKGDARHRKYSLTARGRRVMERLREGREDAISAVWLSLPGDGMRAFTEFGTDLIARLEDYAATHATTVVSPKHSPERSEHQGDRAEGERGAGRPPGQRPSRR